MVTAIIIELETNPFVGAMLKDEFLQDFKQFLTDLKEQDLQRLIRVAQPAFGVIQSPKMKPEFPRIELIAVPPEEEGGKWILIAAPLEINESYEVSLPQSVPCDLSFSLEIAPRPDESLTHTFNVPAIFIAAGSPAKPLVIEYTPSSDGAKTMLVSGRVSEFGEVRQQIVANEVFYAGEPPIIMDSGWSLAGPVPGFDIP